MNPEIALLDQLSHTAMPYFAAEELIFARDRAFALATLIALMREDKVVVLKAETDVPVMTVEGWAKAPDSTSTIAALGAATIDITDKGIRYFLDQ